MEESSAIYKRWLWALAIIPSLRIVSFMAVLRGILSIFMESEATLPPQVDSYTGLNSSLFRSLLRCMTKSSGVVALSLAVILCFSNLFNNVRLVNLKLRWCKYVESIMDCNLVTSFSCGVLGLQASLFECSATVIELGVTVLIGLYLDFLGYDLLTQLLAVCYYDGLTQVPTLGMFGQEDIQLIFELEASVDSAEEKNEELD